MYKYIDEENPLGIVAGGGILVRELIEILDKKSFNHVTAAIHGEVDDDLENDSLKRFSWGEIGKILTYFKNNGCRDLVLIGRINKRPDFRSILGDPGTLMRLPKIIKAMTGGDDSLLKRVIDVIEAEGFRVVGIDEVAPELLLQRGTFGKIKPDRQLRDDIEKAKSALRDIGKHDIGQALVILGGRILAVEGAEGTDGMLRRIKELRSQARITAKTGTGILVKASKPDQDLRVDLPTIGPDTIELAAEAGLAGLVLEEGKVLVAEKTRTADMLDKSGLFFVGEGDFHVIER